MAHALKLTTASHIGAGDLQRGINSQEFSMLRSAGAVSYQETLVQITIDSTEPLDKVLEVIGAVYGVKLRSDVPSSPTRPARARRATSPKSAARRSSTRPQKSSKPAKARNRTRPTALDSAAVRSWARDNGQTVRDRGRVPAAVVEAYLAAAAATK